MLALAHGGAGAHWVTRLCICLYSADTIAKGCSIMGAILNPNKHVPYTITDTCPHALHYSLSAAPSKAVPAGVPSVPSVCLSGVE